MPKYILSFNQVSAFELYIGVISTTDFKVTKNGKPKDKFNFSQKGSVLKT